MSTTATTRSRVSGLRDRAGVGMATAGLLLGGFASITLASPAQAACASDYRHASTGYSYAEAHTEDCSYQSNSYAQHGGDRIWSGWYTGWSWARADSGFSFSYAAANYFG